MRMPMEHASSFPGRERSFRSHVRSRRAWLLSICLGCASFASGGQVTAAHETAGDLLVVTKQSHTLAIVDGRKLAVLAHVPIGEDPHEVVVAPDGRSAFVSHFGDGTMHTLAHVDLVNAKALPPISILPLVGAHGLAVNGGSLWFTAVGSEALGELDPATGLVTAVLGTGQINTHMLWIARDGRKILASNAGSGTMSLFERVDALPDGAASPAPGTATPTASARVEWKLTLLPVGEKAEGFAVSPDERQAWVGNGDGTLSVLDLIGNKAVARFAAGVAGANRLTFTADGARVLVTTHTGKDLVVLDAGRRAVIKRVPIEEHGASGIQLDPSGKRVFVACPRDQFVAVVDLVKLERVATIDVGREPDGMTWWAGPGK